MTRPHGRTYFLTLTKWEATDFRNFNQRQKGMF